MCFNATASISVFTLGLVCIGILLSRKLYFMSVFYFSVIIMQLIEYFAHISLTNNNTKLNKLTAAVAFFALVFQPVVFSLYAGMFETSSIDFLYKIIPFIAIFVALSIKLYKTAQSTNTLRISCLNKTCISDVCRLEWSFFKSNYILSCLFIFLYFAMFILTGKSIALSRQVYKSFNICISLLALSLLYMTFVDRLPFDQHLIESFGSIWCIMATLVGPYLVYSTSN